MDNKRSHSPRLLASLIGAEPSAEKVEWEPVDWNGKRQAPAPYGGSLKFATVAWLKQLPNAVVPLETAHRYPRILNRLARYWDAPHIFDTILENLLFDKRGRRMGFAREIEAEICALGNYYRSLQPIKKEDVWKSDTDCGREALRGPD